MTIEPGHIGLGGEVSGPGPDHRRPRASDNDGRYVNKSGDTMTGNLSTSGRFTGGLSHAEGAGYFMLGSYSVGTYGAGSTRVWYSPADTRVTFNDATDIHLAGGRQVWHSGNDGAGSGLDADLLDGAQSSEDGSGNTIARRNASGDIFARLFRSTFGDNASIPSTAGVAFRHNADSDNYIRFSTNAASFRSWLGLGSAAVQDDGRYALASQSIIAGTHLSGGGTLGADRTITFTPQVSTYISDSQGNARLYFGSTGTSYAGIWRASASGQRWQFRDSANSTVWDINANGTLLVGDVPIARVSGNLPASRVDGLGSAALDASDYNPTGYTVVRRGSTGHIQFNAGYMDYTGGDTIYIDYLVGKAGGTSLLRNITLGNLSTALAPHMIYSGSWANNVTFPIGHHVMADPDTSVARNGVDNIYLLSGHNGRYTSSARSTALGDQLAGTWRFRGMTGNANGGLYQRVA